MNVEIEDRMRMNSYKTKEVILSLKEACSEYVEMFEKKYLFNPDKPEFDKSLSIPYKKCKEAIALFDSFISIEKVGLGFTDATEL